MKDICITRHCKWDISLTRQVGQKVVRGSNVAIINVAFEKICYQFPILKEYMMGLLRICAIVSLISRGCMYNRDIFDRNGPPWILDRAASSLIALPWLTANFTLAFPVANLSKGPILYYSTLLQIVTHLLKLLPRNVSNQASSTPMQYWTDLVA